MLNQSMLTGKEWDAWRSFFSMRRQLDHALSARLQRESAVSIAEYEVLLALHDDPEPDVRIKDISARTGWEKSRVSHQVTRLARRGLVTRTDGGTDGRGSWVTLTSAGRRAIGDAIEAHGQAIRQYFFDALGDGDAELMRSLSERVLTAIQASTSSFRTTQQTRRVTQ
jgi:DNA-binding MarR family transcriptional regulator